VFAALSAPLAQARPPSLSYREAWQAAMRANITIDMSDEYGFEYKIRLRKHAHLFPDADGLIYWHANWAESHHKRRDVVRFSVLVDALDCDVDI
jgi:hypothetical protein